MPQEVDDKVNAIVQSCMREKGKTKKECTSMAYAIVNSNKKEEEKAMWRRKKKKK